MLFTGKLFKHGWFQNSSSLYLNTVTEIFLHNITMFKTVNTHRSNEVYFVDNGKSV